MAIYNGRDQGKIVPKLSNPNRPEISEAEIQAYDRDQAAYNELIRQKQRIGNSRQSAAEDNRLSQAHSEETSVPDQNERIAAHTQAQDRIQKQADPVKKNTLEPTQQNTPAQMTVEEFEKYLRDLSKIYINMHGENALMKPGATVEDYCNALAEALEAQVAIELLRKASRMSEAEKNDFLADQKKSHCTLVTDLRNFVPTQINTERVQETLKMGYIYSPHIFALETEKNGLLHEGLKNYQNATKKPEAEQQLQKDGPKAE